MACGEDEPAVTNAKPFTPPIYRSEAEVPDAEEKQVCVGLVFN